MPKHRRGYKGYTWLQLVDLNKNVPLRTRTDTVRVIRDTRNGSSDYFIPRSEAAAKYEAGILAWDLTNNCYCERN